MNRSQRALVGAWSRLGVAIVALVVGAGVAGPSGAAKVKVRTEVDKTFDFKQARTWAWIPEVGHVVVARTAQDDPDAIQRLAQPIIMTAVAAELPLRGLTQATANPDLALTYHLLLTVNTTAQTGGQFLPANATWGLPMFPANTTSLEMIERGSLVLDLATKGNLVWRGIAEAKIQPELSDAKRRALIPEAVREIAKQYPPKK